MLFYIEYLEVTSIDNDGSPWVRYGYPMTEKQYYIILTHDTFLVDTKGFKVGDYLLYNRSELQRLD